MTKIKPSHLAIGAVAAVAGFFVWCRNGSGFAPLPVGSLVSYLRTVTSPSMIGRVREVKTNLCGYATAYVIEGPFGIEAVEATYVAKVP